MSEGTKDNTAKAADPEKFESHQIHAGSDHIMQFFEFEHLPHALQDVSAPFCSLANTLVLRIPRNPERTVALRKLLEAKDAAVRAWIAK